MIMFFYCLPSGLSHHFNIPSQSQETWFVSCHYLFYGEHAGVFCRWSNFLRFQSWALKSTQSSFYSDEMSCLFYNLIALRFPFISHTQYFETDDQEFYKTKVCFILNNDVSEMDLVFAEEKYSKSGQLEKVRQHFWRGPSPFIPDVISQDRSNKPSKRNHIACLASVLFFLRRGSGEFTLSF